MTYSIVNANTWMEYTSPPPNHLKFLKRPANCTNYSFGVVLLHGTQPNTVDIWKGSKSIEDSSNISTGMQNLVNRLKEACALVIAPNSGIISKHQRWDTNDQVTNGSERRRLNDMILKVSNRTTSKKVILMGGSSGALMVHNVALNIINGHSSVEVRAALKGIVMVDGVSANRVYYLDRPITDIDASGFYAETCLPFGFVPHPILSSATTKRLGSFGDDRCDQSGLDDGKKWNIPTLIISTEDDETIPLPGKQRFAHALGVEPVEVFGNHGQENKWGQKINGVKINGVRVKINSVIGAAKNTF